MGGARLGASRGETGGEGASVAAVGIDVGGSSLRAAAASVAAGSGVTGHAAAPATVARRRTGRDTTRDGFRDLVLASLTELRVHPTALAVAIPSFVLEDGTVGECPSLPALTGLRLEPLLREWTGADAVEVVPDLAAAALGESVHGSGRGVRRFLCVALGTGANAAAVVDGQPVVTAFGCLGDAGHVLVEPDGPVCACGGRGCLEAVASGWALERDARAAGLEPGAPLTAAAEAGDPVAGRLLARAGVALGRAISTWSVLVWPDLVAVAGGVSGAGELLLGPARDEVRRIAPPYVASRLRVERAALGEDATLTGVRHLAAELARRDPVGDALDPTASTPAG